MWCFMTSKICLTVEQLPRWLHGDVTGTETGTNRGKLLVSCSWMTEPADSVCVSVCVCTAAGRHCVTEDRQMISSLSSFNNQICSNFWFVDCSDDIIDWLLINTIVCLTWTENSLLENGKEGWDVWCKLQQSAAVCLCVCVWDTAASASSANLQALIACCFEKLLFWY